MDGGPGHVSVLLNEVLELLKLEAGHRVLDGTLGRAGHAAQMMKRVGSGGVVVGLDKDPEAIRQCRDKFGSSIVLMHEDFRNLEAVFASLEFKAVDAVLLDLGVSSPQLEEAARGFSFQKEGPLDMRMNPEGAGWTAADIINQSSPEALRQILWKLGEERMARRIVERIVEARRVRPIQTTRELEEVVFSAVPKSYRYGRIHPATRTFQALRITVNQELEALEEFLGKVLDYLLPEGRLAIISFHSLEDRLVKQHFREWEKRGMGKMLTKKPWVAQESEMASNPRARSAKLRAFLKAQGDSE